MLEHEIHKLYSSFQLLKSPFFFLSNSYIVYIPWWLSGKESTCNTGDVSWIPGSGRPPPEKEMATHFSVLAWEIPWTEEPGRLQSMGSQRVRHDLVTKQQQQEYVRGSWNTNQVCWCISWVSKR